MKKCPYCGKEYPYEAVRCLIDGELLPGGEPPPLPEPESVAGSPQSLSESGGPAPLPATVLTDWHMRLIEVVLVCAIAFGGGILSSLYSLYYHGAVGSSSGSVAYKWLYASLRQASCLGLLWYVLRRNGRTFLDLGFSWAWTRQDVGRSILLKIGGSLAFYAVYYSIHFAEQIRIVSPNPHISVGYYLFGNSVSGLAILFQFLNPFFEELIVRAYVMTEVRQLTNSVGKAIFVSTALQTSYHFYQGVPAALAHGAAFLIFSIYYAKTNRITPIILAHLYSDVGFTLIYAFHH